MTGAFQGAVKRVHFKDSDIIRIFLLCCQLTLMLNVLCIAILKYVVRLQYKTPTIVSQALRSCHPEPCT
jgi:hypothetical protein